MKLTNLKIELLMFRTSLQHTDIQYKKKRQNSICLNLKELTFPFDNKKCLIYY